MAVRNRLRLLCINCNSFVISNGIFCKKFSPLKRFSTSTSLHKRDDDFKPQELYYGDTSIYHAQFKDKILFRPRKNRPFSEKVFFFMQKRFDFSLKGIYRWALKEKERQIIDQQRYNADLRRRIGPDQNAANVVLSLKGTIRFANQSYWITSENVSRYGIPNYRNPALRLEAVDLKGTEIRYEGLENLEYCRHLTWLSLRDCKTVDDWYLDRITSSNYSSSLLHLDLSNCANISERGLVVLSRLRSLQKLILSGLPNVKFPELMCLLLEDVLPNCSISGINYLKKGVAINDTDNLNVEQPEDSKNENHELTKSEGKTANIS